MEWAKNKREAKSEAEFEALVKPGKVTVLPNCIFRRAKPLVVGVEILAGRLKPKVSLMRAEDSSDLGEIDQIQDQGKAIVEAKSGMQVAISMDKPIAGRHVFERDVLYVKVPEADAKKLLTAHLDDLTGEEQDLLKEFIAFMRKKTLFWAGV
jgi:translation initiation factor 5B